MKIETQMIQNSIFTFKIIDEQNDSLHQHKSTFVVIDYYQGFKHPFLRLVLREFKLHWVDYTSPEFKMASRSGFCHKLIVFF